mmetsp:Transcript_17433/g.33306  ORF Transcript_17433/g.33306 Transcript_17433/m.33306 type:complete len:269 (+) Transcript_17433:640-1446(+)
MSCSRYGTQMSGAPSTGDGVHSSVRRSAGGRKGSRVGVEDPGHSVPGSLKYGCTWSGTADCGRDRMYSTISFISCSAGMFTAPPAFLPGLGARVLPLGSTCSARPWKKCPGSTNRGSAAASKPGIHLPSKKEASFSRVMHPWGNTVFGQSGRPGLALPFAAGTGSGLSSMGKSRSLVSFHRPFSFKYSFTPSMCLAYCPSWSAFFCAASCAAFPESPFGSSTFICFAFACASCSICCCLLRLASVFSIITIPNTSSTAAHRIASMLVI